jgi:hypothetical protein
VDFECVHAWLASSYWSPGIDRERVERGALNSALVLSAFDADGAQVGFLRVVSDKTRFAYLCDVWIEDKHRGKGLYPSAKAPLDSTGIRSIGDDWIRRLWTGLPLY